MARIIGGVACSHTPTIEPVMLPKRPMPSIQLTPVARAMVG